MLRQSEKWQVFYLTLLILLDFMGLATVVVLFPHLFLDPNSQLFPEAWSNGFRVSMLGFFLAIYPLGQFFGATWFGKLSDHYGRRKILSYTIAGTLLGFVLSAIAIETHQYILLFVSRLLAGLCAGNVAIAQASLADISQNEKTKARYITFGQMAMGSAYIVGPILGGVLSNNALLSWLNASTPFWFFSILLAVMWLLLETTYRETLSNLKTDRINVLEGFQQVYQALTSQHLRMGFAVWGVFIGGWWLFESFMPTFLLQKFHFNTMQIGNLLAFNGALYAAFQYCVVQRLTKYLSANQMMGYSAVFAGLGVAAMAFISSVFSLYLAMIVFVLAMGFAIPGLITAISGRAHRDEQGQIMGMIGSTQALGTVIVMIVGGYLNAIDPNIPVFCGGLLIIVSWYMFVRNFNKSKKIVSLENVSSTEI